MKKTAVVVALVMKKTVVVVAYVVVVCFLAYVIWGMEINYCGCGSIKGKVYSFSDNTIVDAPWGKMTTESGESVLCTEEEHRDTFSTEQQGLFRCTDKNMVPVNGRVYYKDEDIELQVKMNFKDGILDGVLEGYFRDGKLKNEGYYKNGKQEGTWKNYYENGQLLAEENFKDGKQEGGMKIYYMDGKLAV
ncbi:MAG: hypothetical protein J6A09_03640, partial [Alphaproteobacteria bacterium]|nr:hypothetical protein [Alphaproteobacteria bacterium]